MRFFLLLFTAMVVLNGNISAQKNTGASSTAQTFTFVEQMPEFPGGQSKLLEYLSQNIHYPDSARNADIQGRVTIKFVINEDGSISDAQLLRGIGGGCDEEALRVVKAMPRWKPGKQQGKPVRVYFTLPITFRLEDNNGGNDYPLIIFRSNEEKELFKAGMQAIKEDNYVKAEERFKKGITLNAANPLNYMWLGLVAKNKGQLAVSEDYMRQGYMKSKASDSIYHLCGNTAGKYLLEAYALTGKYEKGIALTRELKEKYDDPGFIYEYAKGLQEMQEISTKTDAELEAIVANLGYAYTHCPAFAELGMRYERKQQKAAAFLMYSLHNFVNPRGAYSVVSDQVADYHIDKMLSVKQEYKAPAYQLSTLEPLVNGMLADSNVLGNKVVTAFTGFTNEFNRIAATAPQEYFVTRLFSGLMQQVAAEAAYKDYVLAFYSSLGNKESASYVTPKFSKILNDWYESNTTDQK